MKFKVPFRRRAIGVIIVLLIPMILNRFVPNMNQTTNFAISTYVFFMYVFNLKLSLYYEIEENQITLNYKGMTKAFEFSKIEGISVHKIKFTPLKQFFLIVTDYEGDPYDLELSPVLKNRAGQNVVKVITEHHPFNLVEGVDMPFFFRKNEHKKV